MDGKCLPAYVHRLVAVPSTATWRSVVVKAEWLGYGTSHELRIVSRGLQCHRCSGEWSQCSVVQCSSECSGECS